MFFILLLLFTSSVFASENFNKDGKKYLPLGLSDEKIFFIEPIDGVTEEELVIEDKFFTITDKEKERARFLLKNSQQFNWDYVFLSYLKLFDKDELKSYSPTLFKVFYPKQWVKSRDDEFNKENYEKQAFLSILGLIDNTSVEQNFLLSISLPFGEYNFGSESFQFSPIKKQQYVQRSKKFSDSFPDQIRVYFSNYDQVQDVNIHVEKANEILQSYKGKDGIITRLFPSKIIFTLDEVLSGDINSDILSLSARIKSVLIYEDQSMTTLLDFQEYEDDAD